MLCCFRSLRSSAKYEGDDRHARARKAVYDASTQTYYYASATASVRPPKKAKMMPSTSAKKNKKSSSASSVMTAAAPSIASNATTSWLNRPSKADRQAAAEKVKILEDEANADTDS